MVSRSQRLCRLCEFPAAESGIHVADVDAEKWAEWCRRELGEELPISSGAEQDSVICQYCIWEAKLVHESAIDDCCGNNTTYGGDWWTGHDHDHFFREYYFKRPHIQPCKVVLEKILVDGLGNFDVNNNCLRNNGRTEEKIHRMQVCHASQRVENQSKSLLSQKSTFKIFQCSLCFKIHKTRYAFNNHMRQNHINASKCKSIHCGKYFLNKNERQQHEEKFHLHVKYDKRWLKCIYCGALLASRILCRHIKTQHKEAIKCDYNKKCPNYFHTESEKNKHIFNEHTQGLQLKITPTNCIYCNKNYKSKHHLVSHVNKFHKDVRIRCRVDCCFVHFLNQKESDSHFLQVHQHAESFKKWQCPKCSYKSSYKSVLKRHLQNAHQLEAIMKSLLCPKCPKSFTTIVKLKAHIKTVHYAELCCCQYCGKTLLKGSMASHYQSGACKPNALPV